MPWERVERKILRSGCHGMAHCHAPGAPRYVNRRKPVPVLGTKSALLLMCLKAESQLRITEGPFHLLQGSGFIRNCSFLLITSEVPGAKQDSQPM